MISLGNLDLADLLSWVDCAGEILLRDPARLAAYADGAHPAPHDPGVAPAE